MPKCTHLRLEAWESGPDSRKNWNGFVQCFRCKRVFFYEAVKFYLDLKNGFIFNSSNYLL